MPEIGQFNRLTVVKVVPFGLYLDAGELGEVLLPNKVVPAGSQPGDTLRVFLYFDSEDKLIATTKQPRAMVGDFALLKVLDINRVGAFLDWGLDKDLLLPFSEQRRPVQKDKAYLVYIKQDETGRIIASSQFDRILEREPRGLKVGEAVSLMIAETTELGTKAIVNGQYWGLLHREDIFQGLSYGASMTGYIKNIREDGKIDLSLRKPGRSSVLDLSGRILEKLQSAGGFLGFHDKSAPEEIKLAFGDSKKNFKAAIGQLYKQGLILIEAGGIRLKNKP